MAFLRKDLKNSSWLGFQYTIMILSSFIGLKLNLVNFGKDLFSQWLLLTSIWGVGVVMDLGLGFSIIKYVAKHKNNPYLLNRFLSTSLFLFLLVGVLIFGLGNTVAHLAYFNESGLIPKSNTGMMQWACLLLGIQFYFNYQSLFFRGYFEGNNKFVLISKVSLFYTTCIFSSIFFVFLFSLELICLAACFAASALVQLLIFLVLFLKNRGNRHLKLKYIKSDVFRELFGYSFSVQISLLLGALCDPLIKYLIGSFSSRTMIAQYELARRFILAVSGVFTASFKNQFPKISILSKASEYSQFIFETGVKISKFGHTFSGVSFSILAIGFGLLSVYFYQLENVMGIFLVLVLVEVLNNFGYILYMFLMGIAKTKILIGLQSLNILFISGFLIAGFKLYDGAVGMLGYFFSVAISSVFMLYYVSKVSGIHMSAYYAKSHAIALFFYILLAGANLMLVQNYPQKWLYWQIAFFSLSVALYSKNIFRIIAIIKSAGVRNLFSEEVNLQKGLDAT